VLDGVDTWERGNQFSSKNQNNSTKVLLDQIGEVIFEASPRAELNDPQAVDNFELTVLVSLTTSVIWVLFYSPVVVAQWVEGALVGKQLIFRGKNNSSGADIHFKTQNYAPR
jgi:hypothetical protein